MEPPRHTPTPQAYRAAARRLKRWLKACVLCPRACKVDRLAGERGYCRAGLQAVVNTAQLHHGEEPPISGKSGSGTIFFAGCTLGCVFCQNYQISQQGGGEELDAEGLALVFMKLQLGGAHNLNLVTPTPHLVTILEALAIARDNGCHLPVVYNTGGYERAATLRRMDGLIEIYLPDYKYTDPQAAEKFSGAPNYPQHCRAALTEMHRQVGSLQLDSQGVAYGGVLVRHLVLPHGLSQAPQVLRNLVKIAGPEVWVSLMAQYRPMHQARNYPELVRTLNAQEWRIATQALENAAIENGFVQGLTSSNGDYFPSFVL